MHGLFNKLQKQTALLSFNDTSRLKWNNLPLGLRARVGVNIGNMNNDQRRLVHRILSASLSSQATGIMHLDELINGFYDSLHQQKILNDERYAYIRKLNWSPNNFYFAFFSSAADAVWGCKLEGHHLSINFTFAGDKISLTTFFVGTDPAEYTLYQYAGWRMLNLEEDLGLRLVNSLTAEQKKVAIQSTDVPADIITSAESGKSLIDNWGIKSSDLDNKRQAICKP